MKFMEIQDNTQLVDPQQPVFKLSIQNEVRQNELDTIQLMDQSIDPISIYEFSRQNVRLTQDMVIQHNFIPQTDTDNNLKEFRQVQPQSHRLAKLSFVSSKNSDWIKQQKSKKILAQSTQPITPFQNQRKKKNSITVRNFIELQRPQYDKKRVSICLEEKEQSVSNHNPKNDGLIPLKSFRRKETFAVKTYRKVKNRLENIQNDKEKQKKAKKKIKMQVMKQVMKEQNSRFKSPGIAYDYDGEPIPLKYCKKAQVNSPILKSQQSVTIIPTLETMIQSLATNQKCVEKQKEKLPLKDDQKQNQKRESQNEQLVVCEKSSFLKVIPKNTQKFQLFNKQNKIKRQQTRTHTYSKTLDQVTFEEFKNNMCIRKSFAHQQAQPQKSKRQISTTKEKENSKKVHKSFKKQNRSLGKIKTNEQLFEKVFNFKLQVPEDLGQEEGNSEYLTSKLHKESENKLLSKSFYRGANLIMECSSRQNFVRSIDSSGMQCKAKMQRTMDSSVHYQSFGNRQKAKTFRKIFNTPPAKFLRYSQSVHENIGKENTPDDYQRIQQKYIKFCQNYSKTPNILINQLIPNKRKLKTKPSCKYLERA